MLLVLNEMQKAKNYYEMHKAIFDCSKQKVNYNCKTQNQVFTNWCGELGGFIS